MSSTDSPSDQKTTSWREAFAVYLKPRVITMLFLGFSSGLPFVLIFSTLSTWLREAGVERTEIGFFSWIGIMFSIKVFWAPVVDRVALPVLTRLMGKRRSWMVVAQVAIAVSLLGIAFTDPGQSLVVTAAFCLVLAFSAATQDIAIDAYRIEAVDRVYQGAMAATYQFGYRVALIVAGAGALYVAEFFSWPAAYVVMAACALVGFVTVLMIAEPDAPERGQATVRETQLAKEFQVGSRRFLWFLGIVYAIAFFIVATIAFNIGSSSFANPADWARIALSLLLAEGLIVTLLHVTGKLKPAVVWLSGAVVSPFDDFFKRLGWMGAVILIFIGIYRISDITMGIMANPFYIDLGFTKKQIADVAKLYGVIWSMVGAASAGILVARFGIMRPLLLGAVLVATTNLLFAWLAQSGPEISYLIVTISADNFSAGLAGGVFIAYLSSLTNTAYTATQYALFSSLFTLPGKYIGGFSGMVVDSSGYVFFFVYAAALGIPAILLTLYLMRYGPRTEEASTAQVASPAAPTQAASSQSMSPRSDR